MENKPTTCPSCNSSNVHGARCLGGNAMCYDCNKPFTFKYAEVAPKTAVIIKGNPRYIANNPQADKFYATVASHLTDKGYEVSFDAGAPFTEPKPATLWVGHSRGADRLRFAPKDTKTVDLGAYEHPAAVAHANKQRALAKSLNTTVAELPDNLRVAPPDEHYMFTTDMATALPHATTVKRAEKEGTLLLRPRAEVFCFKGNTVLCAIRPDFLVFPGGGVNEGEDNKAAAIRECEEEFGRTPSNLTPTLNPVTCLFDKGKYNGTVTTFYISEDVPQNAVSPHLRHKDYETTGKWRTIKEVLTLLFNNAPKAGVYMPLQLAQQQILLERSKHA